MLCHIGRPPELVTDRPRRHSKRVSMARVTGVDMNWSWCRFAETHERETSSIESLKVGSTIAIKPLKGEVALELPEGCCMGPVD